MKLVFATNNPVKLREINDILLGANLSAKSLSDFGLELVPDESGSTFEENAAIKAVETAELLKKHGYCDLTVFSDDSGLEVEALDNMPGVDSALFMGAATPYSLRNAEIIKLLAEAGSHNRTARFVCVIACAFPDGKVITTRAETFGEIAREPKGLNNFGYDPIFYVPEAGKTMAELSMAEKSKLSHRGKALRQLLSLLQSESS